ncbi:MAG TPA: hypothetical protein VN692_00685 [Steroidobacteraceae bacterium]|nr:hypothetical protein [Steroidobacteraceae bacterium]
MSIHSTLRAGAAARAACCVLAAFGFTTAHAEFVRVTAANSAGNLLYDVTSFSPPPGTISPLNSDGASHGSFSAVVQVENPKTLTVDVLVADVKTGQIIRYTPAVGATPASETVVYSYRRGGPAHPDGLSVDGAGNLYIITSKLNDSTTCAVYVLRANTASATGYDAAPLLIDTTFSTANGVQVLRDTAVATTATAAWNPGDLLVLVGNNSSSNSQNNSNNADVLVYKQQSIARVLSGGGARTAPDFILVGPTQFPAGEYPAGLDFWPADALINHPTLLIATDAGRILRFDFSMISGAIAPNLAQVFASGLGSGLHKLKVGLQLEVPYAFLTQTPASNGGQIVQIGAPSTSGATNVIGIATQGVNGANALAVARARAVPATSCLVPSSPPPAIGSPGSGCTITGAMGHGIYPSSPAVRAAVSGNVAESTCVVLHDPRVVNGICNGLNLDVASVCPAFGHEIIPGTLCGASGNSGSGFALVRTDAPGVDGIAGLLAYGEETVDQILPAISPAVNPGCPMATTAWAPRSDAAPSEGSIVEIDPATGFTEMVELTGFCDSAGSISRGMSIVGVGLTLNTSALSEGLPGYAQTKYSNLFATTDRAAIVPATKATLEASLKLINLYLTAGDYACAVAETAQVDTQVGADPNPAGNYPGDSANPNPWGEIRGRLANLYYTLNTRILARPANAEWPLTTSSPPLCAPPAVTLTAPASIELGKTATIAWTTRHATSCQAADGDAGWRLQTGLSGSYAASPTVKTSYTLICQGAGGSDGDTVTVEVVPAPVVGISATPTSVTSNNEAVTLSWTVSDVSADGTSNPVSCSITADDSSVNLTGIAASGSRNIGALSAAIPAIRTYILTCKNSLGYSSAAQARVNVVPQAQILSFTASASTVTSGVDPVTLYWSSAGAASCLLTGSGGVAANLPAGPLLIGPIPNSVTSPATYQLICRNSLGFPTPAATVAINVVPQAAIGAFSASPSTITSGDVASLRWTAVNATSCTVTGGGATTSIAGASGNLNVSPGTGTTTYALVCANSLNAQTAPVSTTVTAVAPPTIGTFSASPSNLVSGIGSSTLTWSAPGAASCSLTGGSINASGTQGSVSTGPLTMTTTYTLTCGNSLAGTPAATALASISASVTVQVSARLTAANSVGDLLYDVTAFAPPPGPGSTTPLNTDGAGHGSFTSLAYVPNAAGTLDVLVADAGKGQILRYRPGSSSSTLVWSYGSSGSGPAHPDGLSVDAGGNLYVVSSKQNDNTICSIWVLLSSPASPTGYAAAPLLIDDTFASANGVQLLKETVVATSTTAGWSAGDLLVLVGNGSSSKSQNNANDADVFVYRRATIASVIANHAAASAPDLILMNPGQFPAGEYPVGMDFWPVTDSLSSGTTLLVATNLGRILRYDFSTSTPNLVQVFASGLGSGLQKVKVGRQLGVPTAFASQVLSTGGRILELGAPGSSGTNLTGVASQGVQSPDGLAVTR